MRFSLKKYKLPTVAQLFFLFVFVYVSALVFYDMSRERSITKLFTTSTTIEIRPYNQPVRMPERIKLARPLTDEDADYYQKIIALQEKGEWMQADSIMNLVSSLLLKGYVLSQRYLHPDYAAKEEELMHWIDLYSDHPQAYKIYKLTSKYNPAFDEVSQEMRKDYLSGYGDNHVLTGNISSMFPSSYWSKRMEARSVWQKVHRAIRTGRVNEAHKILTTEKSHLLLKDNEIATAYWAIANGYFAQGNDTQGYRSIMEAIRVSSNSMAEMYNSAGIIAWRMDRMRDAALHFQKVAESTNVSEWEASAAAFWAHRAFKREGQIKKAQEMLDIAAKYPRTFYGILAIRLQGKHVDTQWRPRPVSDAERKSWMTFPAVKRALALKQVGMDREAEEELRKLFPQLSRSMKESMIALSRNLGFPVLELRMAGMVYSRANYEHDYAHYPLPPWKPEKGFTIHPALLFALIRNESGFNPQAKSGAGAVGLMQLLVPTAEFIGKRYNIPLKTKELTEPEKNLQIGEKYVEYLLKQPAINGNLFLFLAAYNAGETKLNRWLQDIKFKDDPLLFIESIPARETRNFIEKVMANYWLYKDRFDEDNKTLSQVAKGEWPYYP